MNFKQAVKWLNEGKKVRRPSWEENSFWTLGIDQSICWKDGRTAHIHVNQIEANDWEIYEEKKELKIKVGDYVVNGDSYTGQVVKIIDNSVYMNFKKAGREVTETWDIDHVRLADESEIKNIKESLSDKKRVRSCVCDQCGEKYLGTLEDCYLHKDVREKIQNAQRRLQEEIEIDMEMSYTYNTKKTEQLIDKIFKEEFGEKLIK